MTENDSDDSSRLQASINEAKIQQKQKDSQIQEIRVDLVRIAAEATEKYQREVVALLPEGRRVMREIIEPWFVNIVTSGTYGDLMEWVKTNDRHISLSNTILFYWPDDAIKGTTQARVGAEAYLHTAQFITEHSYSSREEALRRHGDGDEVWRAYFYLRNSKWDSKGNGVILDRDPTIGMGFGAAMHRQFRRVSTDGGNIAGIFHTISPEVWIGFGQQIESGKVLDNIAHSMKPRPRIERIVEPKNNATDYRVRLRMAHDNYLRDRQWH